MTRHDATHDRRSSTSERRFIKRTDRASEACTPCAVSKSKCEDEKPCKRCVNKGLVCETPSKDVAQSPKRKASRQNTRETPTDYKSPSNMLSQDDSVYSNMDPNIPTAPLHPTFVLPPSNDTMETRHHSIVAFDNVTNMPFTEQHFDPFTDDLSFYPDMSNFNQDVDFGLWDFDINSLALPIATTPVAVSGLDGVAETPKKNSSSRNVNRGYAAFKKSPWLWTPTEQNNTGAEHEFPDLDEASIGTTPGMTPAMQNGNNIQIDSALRDRMFALVLMIVGKTKRGHRELPPPFPSTDILSYLAQVFFVREQYQVDSWIHYSTFDPQKAKPDLLLGIIAAGSTLIAVPSIWKLGLCLQEIVRDSCPHAWEASNDTTRELQILQAYTLNLDIGIWSGYKRKMEIAESFAQPITTMLRRAGAFSAARDSSKIVPSAADSDEVVEAKWKKFVRRESFKRLAIHLFLHDTQSSVGLQKNPLMSFTELTFSLPASRELWSASSAQEWKNTYLSRAAPTTQIPRMTDILHDPSLLESTNMHIDISLSSLALLHGFWGQIHAYSEGLKFYPPAAANTNSTHRLWLSTQHRELYRDLKELTLRLTSSTSQPTQLLLTAELFAMMLHVIPDELQRFAGKSGEEEARRASLALQLWSQSSDSRHAVWHAGQVFRAARMLPPAELRGFYAIAVYFASLTLWVYGLMSNSSSPTPTNGRTIPSSTSNTNTPTPGSKSRENVILNDPESRSTRAFLSLSQGQPGLTNSQGEFGGLGVSGFVLNTAREIYRGNFPVMDEPLPTLVQNLGSLMTELGNVSGTGGMVTRAASPADAMEGGRGGSE